MNKSELIEITAKEADISKAAAARHPQTSVSHAGGSSSSKGARSSITGRFVRESTAKRHPDTTIQEG